METLDVTRADGVVTITLNRPAKKNAINQTMWDELLLAFREVARTQDDRVLVITGAGGAFCSGADLSTGDSGVGGIEGMRKVGDVALALHRLAKPTIAKVTGVAAGAGCNLALGCDLIVASSSARFSEIFARRGLSLDFGGSWVLPRLVGLHKAKELAFLAEVIDAAEAERIGIVNHVVADEDIDKFVDDWALRLTHLPPIALSMTKTMLNNSMMTSMDQALEDEGRCQTVNFGTEDMAEAMTAFVTKRDAVFKGR